MQFFFVGLIGAALAWFGGDLLGVYDNYGPNAHYIGAVAGAIVFALLAFALRPRRGPLYRGPAID